MKPVGKIVMEFAYDEKAPVNQKMKVKYTFEEVHLTAETIINAAIMLADNIATQHQQHEQANLQLEKSQAQEGDA